MYPKEQRLRSRTIGSVQNSLTNTNITNTTKPTSSHFLNCRYDPFSPTPVKTYIPDGRGRNVVVRDIKFAHNISVGATETMNIKVMPMLPFPVSFSINGYMNNAVSPTSTIDGFKIGGVTTGGPTTTQTPYLSTIFPNNIKADLNFIANTDVNAVLGARITTIGYRLFYTGAASSAQGTITTTDFAWTQETADQILISSVKQFISADPLAVAATDTISATAVSDIVISQPTMVTNALSTYAPVSRPENGVQGILKYQRPPDVHDFKPWIEGGALVLMQDPDAAPLSAQTPMPAYVRCKQAFATGIVRQNCADPSLMGTLIQLIGTGTYRLEVAVCYEQELSLNNTLIDFARPSPMIDRALLDVDGVMNSTVHPAALNQPIVDLSASMKAMNMGRPSTSTRKRGRRQPKKPSTNQQPKRPKAATKNSKANSGGKKTATINVRQ